MSKKKDTLRIAVVVGSFPSITETFIVNQINALVQLGHEVQLFGFKRGNTSVLHSSILQNSWHQKVDYPKAMPASYSKRVMGMIKLLFSSQGGINFKELRHALNPFKWKKEALGLRWFYKAQWFILNSDFDVVHVHFGPNAIPIGKLRKAGFLKKSKLVCTFHGYDLTPDKIDFYKEKYRVLWDYFDHFTSNTPYLETLLKQVNAGLTNSTVVPVGLDTQLFQPKHGPKELNPFRILFCGRLIPLKGADILLQAVKLLKNQGYGDFVVDIVGEGPSKMSLEEMVFRFELNSVVTFHGALSQDQLQDIMGVSHLLVLPGRIDPVTQRSETQGLVIQEAQAMELAVIVSDVGGMKYGMLPKKSGEVVKTEDAVDLANQLKTFLDHPEKAIQYGRNGREFVLENYDYLRLGKVWVDIYHKT